MKSNLIYDIKKYTKWIINKCLLTLEAPSLRSDSDSELSASGSEEEEDGDDDDDDREKEEQKEKENEETVKIKRTPSKGLSAALYKTPAKKSKRGAEPVAQSNLVEEYFEAHSSSKVLTSDRTLERLHTPKLDRVSMRIHAV